MRLLPKTLLFTLLFFKLSTAISQTEVLPDKPVLLNGIEYGYSIINTQSKEDYERYEIRFYITNNSNCNKIILKRSGYFGSTELNRIAEFVCNNATGKRLTSKSQTLLAKEWYLPIEDKTKDASGKDIIVVKNTSVGYILRNGETVFNSCIMLTAKGEQPIIKVIPTAIRDL